ncbi:ATP-dependent helicase [Culicoidibacter larvae]|uniref:DNA 3'-5' helicase n=1 Tax=Culicoidibacter larvae TaxID=2579976 RepID=A0A5R8Q8M8_9FIRM|nr:UvrD-helicase domain-containing protein [Culicoidibacter larvae]TLG71529.1 ATP-dependent DNA helicase PcrA [Culicoidibacter larvae]
MSDAKHRLLDGLNANQQQAVSTTEGYVRVIAGAGSGKTRVLTHRVAYIVEEHKAWPSEILAITFTNKAAAEMRERIDHLLPDDSRSIWIMTYHALCARILRMNIDALGYPRDFIILDSDDQKQVLKNIYAELHIDIKEIPYNFALSHISNSKMDLINPKDAEASATFPLEVKLASIYKAYVKYLTAQKVLDFDDLLLFTYKLLKENAEVLAQYQRKFKYIHVDEFQDTNGIQFEIVKMLSGMHENLCIVGDPDQAIYGWRGADPKIILDFEQYFKGVQTIILDRNYRSTQSILNAANKLIEHNRDRVKKDLQAHHGMGEAVSFFEAADDTQEAQYVAHTIDQLLAEHGNGILNDIAVLYRSNYLSRILETTLIDAHIPYRIYGDIRFYERKEIKDMISYLRLIHNPNDDLAFNRVVNEPKRGIGPKAMSVLADYAEANNCSRFECLANIDALGFTPKVRKALSEFAEVIIELHELQATKSLADIFAEVYQRSGYKDMLTADPQNQSRVENINALETSLKELDTQESDDDTSKLAAYLQDIALYTSQDDDQNDDGVTLMTVHSAKGLEFDYVFIYGMNDAVFPSKRSLEEGNIEEERRLAYVAMTRAKKQLYITASAGYNFISKMTKVPSLFLNEAGLWEGNQYKNERIIQKPLETFKKNDRIQNIEVSTDFKTGQKVTHNKYGDGIIVSLDGDLGTIAFAKPHGIKTIVVSHQFLKIKE